MKIILTICLLSLLGVVAWIIKSNDDDDNDISKSFN